MYKSKIRALFTAGSIVALLLAIALIAPLDTAADEEIVISGTVFNDLSGNGSQEPGEPGIEGVTVTVQIPSGTLSLPIFTDENGEYSYVVPAGSAEEGEYIVREEDPEGYISVTSNRVTRTLAPGDSATVDFADKRVRAISGVVFDDLNGDGVRDSGEPGIEGVTITVQVPGGTVSVPIYTDVNGMYEYVVPEEWFVAGRYTVTEEDLPGYISITPNTKYVYLTENESGTANFADQSVPTVISGTVFDDRDGDGQQGPDEKGIPDVAITVSVGPGGTLLTPVFTDENGDYEYTLPQEWGSPNEYTVIEEIPEGYVNTTPDSVSVTLEEGEFTATVDFGNRRAFIRFLPSIFKNAIF